MRRLLPLLLGSACLIAAPLPEDSDDWFRDPLQWRRSDGGWRATGNASSLNVCEGLPLVQRAELAATVRAGNANPASWSVAAVALVHNAENFWHLALVQAPEASGGRRYFELCEMLDGQWLAQNRLTVEFSEEPGTWEPEQDIRLKLTLDPEGIEGTAAAPDGTLLFRRRFAFSDHAVTCGRPALRAAGFEAEFRNLDYEGSEELAERRPPPTFPAYTSTSFVPGLGGDATGFFRVEPRDGKWWAFDPLGRGFIPLGIDHVRYSGSWCEALGYAPHGRKNDAKFANREEWEQQTLDRLTSWGFNLLAASFDTPLRHRGLAHTAGLNVGSHMASLGDEFDITPNERRPCSAFPNVFHPDFEAFCRFRARTICAPQAGNPWLFGYFLDNELAWWGRGATDTGLFDATMGKVAAHTAKLGLVDVLKRHFGNDLAALNRAFAIDLASFDAVLELEALSTATDAARAAKHAFLTECAERYFGILTRAIREADPNHMILGARFAGGHLDPIVWETAGKYSDILSFNFYGSVDLDRRVALAEGRIETAPPLGERFAEFHAMGGGRPMMVTEWSFPALDSGLPCTKGAGQRFRTQAERSEASDIYARTMLALPFLIGYNYFMWVDQPALGISTPFPENSNYGITNEDGVPYPGLVRVLSAINLGDAVAIRRTGETGIAPAVAAEAPGPPAGPEGTEWVLWNQTGENLPLAIAAMPKLGETSGWSVFRNDRWLPAPSQAAGALAALPSVPARSPLFLKRSPHAEMDSRVVVGHFAQSGQTWTARRDKWELAGTIGEGPLVPTIVYDGVPLGRYNGMIQQFPGANRWNETTHVTEVRTEEHALGLVLVLVGEFRPAEGDRAQGFRLVHRLTFPGGADYFAAQCLEVANLGDEPLNLRALFFRFHGAIGGSAEGDVPADDVPRLWKADPRNAWYDPEADAFFGATATRSSTATIRFWLNQQGGQHPDARIEYEQEIAPGATFVPPEPAVVYGFAGKGRDWQSVAARVAARQALYRPVAFQP